MKPLKQSGSSKFKLSMKRLLKIILIIVGIIFVWSAICLSFILSKVNDRPQKLTGFDTILVLGSQIYGKNLAEATPAPATKDRLDAAVTIYRENPQATLIVSGAKGWNESVTEAAGMAKYLEAQGVPQKQIIEENRAENTSQNLSYSKPFFKGKTIVVTSNFHLYRTLYLAQRLGIKNISGYAAAAPTQLLLVTGFYSHEILGVTYAWFFGNG